MIYTHEEIRDKILTDKSNIEKSWMNHARSYKKNPISSRKTFQLTRIFGNLMIIRYQDISQLCRDIGPGSCVENSQDPVIISS